MESMKITRDEISGFSLGYGLNVMRSLSFWSVICALCVAGPFCAVLSAQSYLTSTGVSSFSMPYPVEMGTVDAASGNLHLEIPLGSFPQRGGGALVPKLTYDSHMWTQVPDVISGLSWAPFGEVYGLAVQTWGLSEGVPLGLYNAGGNGCNLDYMLLDQTGTQHYFNIPGTPNANGCSGGTAYATDGSGLMLVQPGEIGQYVYFALASGDVYAPDGTEVYGADDNGFEGYPPNIVGKDSNGNYFSLTNTTALPGLSNPVVDTLGRTIVNPIITMSGGNIISPVTLQVMNSEGGVSAYVVNFTTIAVQTNFGQSGVTECRYPYRCGANYYSSVVAVITSIGLPDGSSYSFLYDCDETLAGQTAACNSPGGQSGYYGTLTSMTLPTGATINYVYSMFEGVSWQGEQFPSRWLTSKSSSAGTWSYTPLVTAGAPSSSCLSGSYKVGCMQTTVQRPDGSKEITSFIVDPFGGSWPQTTLSYDTDGATLLSTVNNTWNFSTPCTLNLCDGNGYQYVRKSSTSTTLPVPGGSITKQTAYTYDTPQTGNVTSVKEWKYQNGTAPTFPAVPDRATYTTYATIGGNNNINRPKSIIVCNNVGTNSSCTGGGTPVAQTTITYDGYGSSNVLALQNAPTATTNHDTTYGTSYLTRGNATQISKWVAGTTYLTTYLSYDTTGQVIQAYDPNLNKTTYSYTDSFYDDNGADPPAAHSGAPTTNAYVTTVTDAIGSTSMGYYYRSGQTALSTDYNGVTTYGHYVDPFDRPTKTDYPIGFGWLLNVYGVPSNQQTEIDSYAAVADTGGTGSASCTLCTHTQALLDGLGRAVTGNLVNNPAGEVSVTSVYDGLNRVSSSSHPHIGTGDPNNVSETMYYDGLGRAIATRHPDSQVARSAYGAKVASLGGLTSQQSSAATYGYGFPVVSVDEAGKQKQEWIDGFGRVIEVDEPSTNTGVLATATITISGSAAGNSGSITVTVNGFAATAYWCASSTAASVAASLGVALGSALSPVAATVNGTAVTMTAVGYAPSFSVSYSKAGFIATPASGTFTGGTGGITYLPSVTTYTYDVLGNLTGVTQGAQTRSWQYDGLSRLTREITAEAGTVNISYVAASGALCSGNPSNPCSRIAPAPNQTGTATVTTTYTYNTANQLTQKTHSDTTGTESYCYGSGCGGGSGTTFMIGRLATMTDPSGSEAYSYDQIGRVTKVVKTIGSTPYTMQYAYNAGDQLTSVTYPSGRVVGYNYDSVGHLCQVATSVSGGCNSTAPYLTLPSGSYDAAGRPLSATYGNGVVATAAYSPLTSELTSIRYAKGSTPLFGLIYYYQQQSTKCPTGNPVGNNGQIQCIFDFVQPSRSVSYTYDQLERLSTATTAGGGSYAAWGIAETYDRYGNRATQSVTAGSAPAPSFTINPVNNQITSFTYDAAGNVISEPSPLSASYTYDGEECNTGFAGNGNSATYLCDGNHLRVQKVANGVPTVSVRSGGQVIAEYDNGVAVNSPTREYLYGHNLLAIVTGSISGSGGTIIYQHRDHLSPRLYTDVNGNDVGEQGTFAFGESWYSNSQTSQWIFTSYERDQESGNDYALARSYASNQGRFLAPDPLEGAVGDPQSWNRYAYVENDPIDLSDPSGQGFWDDLGHALLNLVSAFAGGEFARAVGGILPAPPSQCANLTTCTGPPIIFSENGGQNGTQDPTAQNTTPQYQNPQNEAEARLSNVVYNETSSLRPDPKSKPGQGGSAEALQDAREGVAEVANRVIDSGHPGRVAPSELNDKDRRALSSGNADAINAHNASLAAARQALGGANNTSGDTQYRLRTRSVSPDRPINGKDTNFVYGPFINTIGRRETVVFAP